MPEYAFPEGSVWLFGCGNMAGAMLRRWLAAGLDPAQVTAITRTGRGVPAGVRSLTSPPSGERPAMLVLGVKPQQIGEVTPVLAAIRPAILVSILAGVELATLARAVPGAGVVRAMPNLPVATGEGVVALHARGLDHAAAAGVASLMTPLGLVEWIDDEPLFDAVTALSGCGPGFVFRFIDAMARAGAALGLAEDQALRLATATVAGSAAMAKASDEAPALLADRVASPGGSTREGLNVLDHDDALVRLMTATLAASARRNREMASFGRDDG